MDNPYSTPKSDLQVPTHIELSEPAIAKATYTIDANYVIARNRCRRRMRIDHQLRGYLKIIGIPVLSIIAISQAVNKPGELFWVIAPCAVVLYLLFGVRMRERLRVFIYRLSGLLDKQASCEFFREGILVVQKDSAQFVTTDMLKTAALFKEGLTIVSSDDSLIFIPQSAVSDDNQLVGYLRSIVPFDERYD